MTLDQFSKTMMVWWRFGNEHGDDDFRANPPDVIAAHIQRKVDRFRQTPADAWRWWQVDDDLIVERCETCTGDIGPDTRLYYLLKRGLTIMENIHLPPPEDNWKWLVRISDFLYRPDLACWVMKDLFWDICVESDNRTYHLFDLPDLAQALDIGLISSAETRDILKRVDWLVGQVAKNTFPTDEILRGQAACRQLGWG